MTDFEAEMEDGLLVPASAEPGGLDLLRFPELPPGSARPVYFDALSQADLAELARRGYAPRLLMSLPRGTPKDEAEYLLAKAQAMEEGTVPATKVLRETLELEMKANRMLGQKSFVARLDVKADKSDIRALLETWTSSRHTLRGNSTIVEANAIPKETSSTAGGKKRKGKK